MYQDFKMQVVTELFNIAGMLISQQTSSFDKQQQLSDEYFDKTKAIVEKEEKKQPKPKLESRKEEVKEVKPILSLEGVGEGTACVACSNDHFSTTSGMLNEALRFKKEGMNSWEIQRRIGIALDELNSMERGDLHADQIAGLKGKEKQLANEAKDASRDLRHKINAIHSFEDLEKVAAEAANVRTKFMRNVFTLSMEDGTMEKLCKNVPEAEKERCIERITAALKEHRE